MTMTLLWPVVPFILQVGLFALWGIMAVYVGTAFLPRLNQIHIVVLWTVCLCCSFLSSAGDSQGCVRNPYDTAAIGQRCDICDPLTFTSTNNSVCIFQKYARDQ